jgi:hypothetical protein
MPFVIYQIRLLYMKNLLTDISYLLFSALQRLKIFMNNEKKCKNS